MGNSDVTVGPNSDLYIMDKHFKGTRGLWELITRNRVDNRLLSEHDLKLYEYFGFNQRSLVGFQSRCQHPHFPRT